MLFRVKTPAMLAIQGGTGPLAQMVHRCEWGAFGGPAGIVHTKSGRPRRRKRAEIVAQDALRRPPDSR